MNSNPVRRVALQVMADRVRIAIETGEGQRLAALYVTPSTALVLSERLADMAYRAGGAPKFCPRCEVTKNRAEFYSDRSRGDGLSALCRVCKLEDANARHAEKRGRKQGQEAA